ncbi:hypothetical protein [Nocardia farcinica]|uniref:hypothetical protein n=1 Tax=Nocardia farcinica TaxID=37329 RepID=UPI002457D74A|nr:hypothetical protein [Nocardia farcinica]
MERARPHESARDRRASSRGRGAPGARALAAGVAVTAAVLLAGCDSVSGIPGDEPVAAAEPVATEPVPSSATTAPAPPPTSTLPPPPADAPEVGAVPGVPEAATAVRRWAADLETDTIAELQDKCWTLPPGTVADMYAQPQTILAALARPGTATADTVTWKSAAATVTVERAAIATGYACPRVYGPGETIGYDDADARHTVRRYLSRLVGEPLDPADTEDAHPLLCAASPATWDPAGSGRKVPAPLAANPGKLTGVTAFDGDELTSQWLSAGYITVDVPVTTAAGTTTTRTFTLAEGEEGYCLGDVTR